MTAILPISSVLPTPDRRLKFVSVGDFLADQPEEMPWIIKPLCAVGSSVMIYGRQKVGKSSVTMQLFDSLINGKPWLGFGVYKTGRVLYLQCDMALAEVRRIIERAEDAGMGLRDGLFIPQLTDGEQTLNFNILNPLHSAELRAWCEELKPIAVVVDTINDAYEPDSRIGDVNSFIRKVHRSFKEAIGESALIFLNHKRKQIQNFKGEEVDDEDGYLGGTAWAGVVASNLELRRNKDDRSVHLELRDLRLDTYPTSSIPLLKNVHGFFEPKLTSQMMLYQWPDCIDPAEWAALKPAISCANDVFRDIAKRTATPLDTVKKQYQRHRNVPYPWLGLVGMKPNESEGDVDGD